MKKYFKMGFLIAVVAVIAVGVIYRDTLLLIYRSINAYLKSGFEIIEKEHNNTGLPAPVRMVCHKSLKV